MKTLFLQHITKEGYAYEPLDMINLFNRINEWFGMHTWCDTGMSEELTEQIINLITKD